MWFVSGGSFWSDRFEWIFTNSKIQISNTYARHLIGRNSRYQPQTFLTVSFQPNVLQLVRFSLHLWNPKHDLLIWLFHHFSFFRFENSKSYNYMYFHGLWKMESGRVATGETSLRHTSSPKPNVKPHGIQQKVISDDLLPHQIINLIKISRKY